MSNFPAHAARIRVTTFDGEVREFAVTESSMAYDYYEAMQSSHKSMPRMVLLDANGQEIPTMTAD